MLTEEQVRWPDALKCNHCGKIFKRGIMNAVEHYEKCNGAFGDIEDVYDAEFEIAEPKQLPNNDKTPTI